MEKQGYTTTKILTAYVKYLTIECGDTCNTKSENWSKAKRLFREKKIDIEYLIKTKYL